MGVVVIRAIQKERRLACESSRNRHNGRRIVPNGIRAAVARALVCHTGKKYEFRYLAAVEWQFENALIVNHCSDSGTARLDERCVSLNLNGLTDLADLQNRIDGRITIDLKDDSGL